jgi:hypothetical protein
VDGVYDADVHIAQMERRESRTLPPGVSAADYVAAHVKRANALARRGLIEPLGGERFRIPEDLLTRIATSAAPGRDSGRLIQVTRLARGDLDTQVTINGITWLDRQLAVGADPNASVRVGAPRLERQIAAALRARVAHLTTLGLGASGDRSRTQLLNQLYQRELKDAERRLQGFGERVALQPGQSFEGRLAHIEPLPSGAHAVVAEAGQYALIPATPAMTQQLGRSLGLTIGRRRALDRMEPHALKLALRIRFVDLKPTRHRGR